MFYKILITGILLLLMAGATLYPQQDGRQDQVGVKSTTGSYYRFPWAGGMNSCQFGSVDLDLDGKKDLVVFDRTGSRIMPFINTGGPGVMEYQFAPEYADHFPVLYEWAKFVDYNRDGREDIFSYSPGYAGMMVYRNISDTELEYERVVYPYLTSFQGAGFTNILVTYVDYPGIADIDGDGDMDILTFWGLGSFVEMHRNLSYEKYGHYDSLDYEKTSLCWGYFAESEESNELTLDTCVGWGLREENRILLPHTGSTFLVIDLDGDQVQDILLGDVDYPNLVALRNGGTTDSAYIASFELHFPAYDRSVSLYSLPVAAHLDVDNDGINDLLVSPFDPNPYLVENKLSSWLYRNTASNEQPEFRFEQDDFLQEDMIDVGAGSYPVLADYNGDGLADLFIGNYGYYDSSYLDQNLILHTEHTSMISLYENIGTEDQPAFTFITDDLGGLSSLQTKGIVPSFADLDNDGDLDMVCGSENGKLMLFENIAGQGATMELELVDTDLWDIDVGDYSTPQLFDLDQDGTTDLIIGERNGNINYYRGLPGNGWLEFSSVTDSLGKVNVTDPELFLDGYSTPHFFKDNSGNTLLITGSKQGQLYFYTDIDDNLTGKFILSDTLAEMLGISQFSYDRGYQTSAVTGDLDGDGIPDMIVGNFSGGLEYFSASTQPQVSGTSDRDTVQKKVKVYPNPARTTVTIDITALPEHSLEDMALIDLPGQIVLQNNHLVGQSYTLELSNIPAGLYFIKLIVSSVNDRKSVVYKKLTVY
jgi:hypothetical protein